MSEYKLGRRERAEDAMMRNLSQFCDACGDCGDCIHNKTIRALECPRVEREITRIMVAGVQ
jgi:hypothetical protein